MNSLESVGIVTGGLDLLVKSLLFLGMMVVLSVPFRRSEARIRHRIWWLAIVGLLIMPLFLVIGPNLLPGFPGKILAAVAASRQNRLAPANQIDQIRRR